MSRHNKKPGYTWDHCFCWSPSGRIGESAMCQLWREFTDMFKG